MLIQGPAKIGYSFSCLYDQQLSVNVIIILPKVGSRAHFCKIGYSIVVCIDVMFISPKVGLRAHFWLVKKLVAG